MRDGHLYARGACDDKGNFYALLRAALDLAAAGDLGVNVRVLADGEEEIGGHSVMHHLAADVEGDCTAAVIFDGSIVDANLPAITTGLRGLAGAQMRLTTGTRELHSGLYGGVAANPVHDLHRLLAAVIDLPAGFSEGIAPVARSERDGWSTLAPAPRSSGAAASRPPTRRAGDEFYGRHWARRDHRALGGVGGPDAPQDVDPDRGAGLALGAARPGPGRGRDVGAPREDAPRRLSRVATLELEMWPPGEPAFMDPTDPRSRSASTPSSGPRACAR